VLKQQLHYQVPIDVVKTRLQTDPNLRNANIQTATSLILQQDGLNALLGNHICMHACL
jgi:hypothetical protein